MSKEELLDLARIDILPAANDHVFDTADDVAIPVVGNGCEISGMHPSCRVNDLGLSIRLPPVPVHHGIAPGTQLAAHPAWHDASPVIDNLHFQMRMNLSNGGYPAVNRI